MDGQLESALNNKQTYYNNVYVAASFAYEDREKTNKRKSEIEDVVSKINLKTNFYLPHQLKIENAWDISLEEWSRKVFEEDLKALNEADLVIFISYGKENNSGSVWEVGYAYGKQIPIIMIKMTDGAESLMITNSVRAIIQREDISTYDFTTLPEYKTILNKIS